MATVKRKKKGLSGVVGRDKTSRNKAGTIASGQMISEKIVSNRMSALIEIVKAVFSPHTTTKIIIRN